MDVKSEVEIKEALAKIIRKELKKRKITGFEFSRRTKICRTRIATLVAGRTYEVSLSVIIKMARALGYSVKVEIKPKRTKAA